MVNSEPLLPINSVEIQNGDLKEPPMPFSSDDLDGSSGNLISQFIHLLFVFLAWTFDAQLSFVNIFSDADPAWHCTSGDSSGASSCFSASTPCGLPPESWAWDFPAHASMISEWALECASPTVVGLPASAFFAGSLAGGILLATLSDSALGRKNMLLLSCLTMSLTGILTALAPDVWTYSALRFLCGFGRSTVCTTALILLSETVSGRWRDKGANKIDADASKSRSNFSTIKIIWDRKWASQRLIASMIAGFGIGMVYTGMPLNAGNLGTDIYLSTALNAVAEVPSALAALVIVGVTDRRLSVLGFTAACGALNIACVFLETKAWQMAAEVASFFSVCTAFDVLLIYCVEMFPTCVRGSAISLIRLAIVLGGAIAPMLVAVGRRLSFVSFGVFGVVIVFCGMATVCLPETKGRSIRDTMEEEEEGGDCRK
ncbi:organic cation/carnitine transporter 2-like isoform X2 [Zingiber officinale]|uniref:organic cation/carnitine transporter 2-like isoform X2 n=1 Tax=Zingiber officinale TaxID=94328 RepID=UPI001C4BE7DD|nr:organic cation/carnitine transporter 2-like isoform X2 [Zingiber officinale]